MTKSRYGFIAGIAGAAFAAWWYRRSHRSQAHHHPHERGEVIFRNTPEPAPDLP